MQVVHVPNHIRLSLPPIYIWPQSLKRVIQILAVVACLDAYILLAGGLVGVVVLFLKTLLG
jgi:hypothetical protein